MNERNIDSVEQIDDNEEERIKRLIEEESQRRANAMATKIFKKNRREIKRLNDHAAWRSGGNRSTNVQFCTKVQSKN